MTRTSTDFVGYFDSSFYQALAEKASRYFIEDPQISWIPQALVVPLHASSYKKPVLGASIGIRGAHKLGAKNVVMDTPRDHITYNLEYLYGDIDYNMNDLLVEGKFLVERKAQELATWQNQSKQSIFKGVYTDGFTPEGVGQGELLNTGIIEQASLVTNFSSSADALLDAAGDVRLALDAVFSAIPFRYRDGRKVLIGMDDLFVRKARTALFRGVNGDQESELDIWFREHSNEVYILPGQIAESKPLISDSLFLNKKAGATKTEVDVLGTNSRLFSAIVHPDLIEQAYSYLGPVGEEPAPLIQGLTQRWAARLVGCVHDPNAVQYTERITWA